MALIKPISRHPNFKDRTGRWFGNLFCAGYAGMDIRNDKKRYYWWCICRCGTSIRVDAGNLTAGQGRCRRCRDGVGLLEAIKAYSTVTESGCWEWSGKCLDSYGYGIVTRNKKTMKAHRVAYELFKGPIPDGMCVCHTCDNRRCCNPSHLWLGTNADNIRDKVDKGRHVQGERQWSAKLNNDKVRKIRELASTGLSAPKIAERFGVGNTTVYQVINQTHWKHVT